MIGFTVCYFLSSFARSDAPRESCLTHRSNGTLRKTQLHSPSERLVILRKILIFSAIGLGLSVAAVHAEQQTVLKEGDALFEKGVYGAAREAYARACREQRGVACVKLARLLAHGRGVKYGKIPQTDAVAAAVLCRVVCDGSGVEGCFADGELPTETAWTQEQIDQILLATYINTKTKKVSALEDPDLMRNRYGLVIQGNDAREIVVTVAFEGGSAHAQGVSPGDKLIAINGEPVPDGIRPSDVYHREDAVEVQVEGPGGIITLTDRLAPDAPVCTAPSSG